MTDIKTAADRSKNMARIRSKNTGPELYLRKLLFSRGLRYRLYSDRIPGHPDMWLKKYKTAIFVNGCFWHRHKGCKYAYIPKSRLDFWNRKFDYNIRRDQKIQSELKNMKVKCLVIWECSIKKMRKDPNYKERVLIQISDFLISNEFFLEI